VHRPSRFDREWRHRGRRNPHGSGFSGWDNDHLRLLKAASSLYDASPSSLELTLDHKKIVKCQNARLAALAPLLDCNPDATGLIFAINGRLNSDQTHGTDCPPRDR
jgi:hypothetical protein